MDQSHIAARLDQLFADRRPSRWVTRERPKIDRIACPWLILRYIDPEARFVYVPAAEVIETARRTGGVAFDIPGAEPFTHHGPNCSFDAFIEQFQLEGDPGLHVLAPIIRAADTDRHRLAPEAAGLHAVSLGLSVLYNDDQALLRQGLMIYDALHAWATQARGERHDWRPRSMSAPRGV